MLPEAAELIVSILAILFTAEVAIRYSGRIAERHGLSGTFVGLTVLSIGASLPEIFTAVVGGLRISEFPSTYDSISAIVVGANVGSDIFQQTFILGIVGLIFTLRWEGRGATKDILALIGATALLSLFLLDGELSRLEGVILVGVYIAYIYTLLKAERIETKTRANWRESAKDWAVVMVALVLMGLAADVALVNIHYFVVTLGISATLLGGITLGIVAAVPELTTAMLGRNKPGLSEGILIGSNITNPLLALGLGAMISGFHVPQSVLVFDVPFKLGSAVFLFLLVRKSGRLTRLAAVSLIVLYIAYLVARATFFLHE